MERIWTKHKQLNTTLKPKVFVAMSGGVDSSVAAMLLKNAYLDSHGRVRIAEGHRPEARYSHAYDVVGVFMRCYNIDGCQDRDAEDARRVAEHLQIPFYVWDFEEEYKKRVVAYMVEGYRAGITPNPDVMCNREIKFGLFFEKALAMGADYITTGHYVVKRETCNVNRNHENALRFTLHASRDANKDQSYFLWTLTQKQLAHCLFPIGDYTKPEVRAMAKQAGLPTAEKKDSQGICFLGQVTIADFLKEYIPARRGEVLTTAGDIIGEHDGAHLYTIGQRHLGIRYQVSGVRGRHETKPHYVAEKNITTNTLTVAEGSDHPALYKKEIELADINFINPHHSYILENVRMKVLARVRYRQPLSRAYLRASANSESQTNLRINSEKHNSQIRNNIRYSLMFDDPQKFIAVGQSAVFYINEDPSSFSTRSGRSPDGLQVLGGGVIVGAQ